MTHLHIDSKLLKENYVVAIIILLILVALLAGLIVMIVKKRQNKKEHLDVIEEPKDVEKEGGKIDPKEASHATELKQPDLQIKPTFFDAGSGVIMSGQEFIPTQFLSPWYKAYTGNVKNQYLLDDGAGGSAGLQFNMCSKSCCSEQYPLPFKMPVDSAICNSKDKFVPNNYTCNNAWQDSGCVCMTEEQADFIGSRGGNA
jgi:hypothetical protein